MKIEALRQIVDLVVFYISSLILPFVISYGSIMYYSAKFQHKVATLWKFGKTLAFPKKLIFSVYMSDKKEHAYKEKPKYVLANLLRTLGTVFYVFIIIGLFSYAQGLWAEKSYVPSVLCGVICLLSIIHLVESWHFGRNLRSFDDDTKDT